MCSSVYGIFGLETLLATVWLVERSDASLLYPCTVASAHSLLVGGKCPWVWQVRILWCNHTFSLIPNGSQIHVKLYYYNGQGYSKVICTPCRPFLAWCVLLSVPQTISCMTCAGSIAMWTCGWQRWLIVAILLHTWVTGTSPRARRPSGRQPVQRDRRHLTGGLPWITLRGSTTTFLQNHLTHLPRQ